MTNASETFISGDYDFLFKSIGTRCIFFQISHIVMAAVLWGRGTLSRIMCINSFRYHCTFNILPSTYFFDLWFHIRTHKHTHTCIRTHMYVFMYIYYLYITCRNLRMRRHRTHSHTSISINTNRFLLKTTLKLCLYVFIAFPNFRIRCSTAG